MTEDAAGDAELQRWLYLGAAVTAGIAISFIPAGDPIGFGLFSALALFIATVTYVGGGEPDGE